MNLKPEDAARLIGETHSDTAVLIGGQAVSIWSRYFNIRARLPTLTNDIDYLGTKTEAKRASDRLTLPHKLKIATFDDNTPSSGLLSVELEGYAQPVLVDYLAAIVGLESKAIEKSAVVVEFQGKPLRILHPLQLLQAKIWNLYRLERKRTPEGIEQARLAIEIAAAFIERAGLEQRDLLDAIEAIGRFALTNPARFAEEKYGLDSLKAVPACVLKKGGLPENFRKKRWPQILASARKR